MYLLFALTAGLVGCFHINRLYKFSEGVWREFRECGVSAYPLNKLFKVFYLPFLYFDFFLQIYDFNFKLRLFVLVSLLTYSLHSGVPAYQIFACPKPIPSCLARGTTNVL